MHIGVDPAREGPDPREILLERVHHCLDPRKISQKAVMSEARLWNTVNTIVVNITSNQVSIARCALSSHVGYIMQLYSTYIHLELLSSAVSEQFNNGLSAARPRLSSNDSHCQL